MVYVTDAMPGIRRLRRGGRFAYRLPDGRPLRDAREIARIQRLAIPPAYTDVWICPLPDGHLQATGRDARGRKQYRYHPDWRLARDADKFARMLEFGRVLPRIRRRVHRDLAQPAGARPGRASVLAALVRLLDTTLVRIGNDEYARTNKSYGLTTLRNRHADVRGDTLRLRFKGKHGIVHDVSLDDPRIARLVRRCQAMPGQELFEYEDADGTIRGVGSADVNEYLREAGGADFTAKDFRTWHATVHALQLCLEPCDQGGARRSAKEVLTEVAGRLGNTVAVCRKSYVHPKVLALALGDEAAGEGPSALAPVARRTGLSAAEAALMQFLGGARRPARLRA
ncbi:MAG TPA: DNA topoisomerase IB [Albitalea sp.]|nr:DNA topoisomerase IB [Albitalea sp.]